jgi:hypothetical protein
MSVFNLFPQFFSIAASRAETIRLRRQIRKALHYLSTSARNGIP